MPSSLISRFDRRRGKSTGFLYSAPLRRLVLNINSKSKDTSLTMASFQLWNCIPTVISLVFSFTNAVTWQCIRVYGCIFLFSPQMDVIWAYLCLLKVHAVINNWQRSVRYRLHRLQSGPHSNYECHRGWSTVSDSWPTGSEWSHGL